MSSRREWEPVYEKHPKLSALSRVTHARESERATIMARKGANSTQQNACLY